MDQRAKALFADAERSAERVIGQLRMAIALSLGAVFAIAVVTHAQRDDAVLAVQIAVASATIVAYLALGAFSYHVAAPHRFRRWMPWAFVTGDAGFLLSNVGLNFITSGVGGNYVASFPALWLAPVVLAFGALQYNPARLLYATALLACGLVAIAAADFGSGTLDGTPRTAIDRYFDAPPNIMRLAMLISAGAILVAAAARTRTLLQRAINEARRGANLTRYLPAEIADQLAESGLTALREGRRQPVAVMFVDIRGFTTLAETMDPAATGRLLADFRRFVAATQRGGVVDKFIGDAAMLVFGLPSPRPDDARRALSCACALLAGTPGEWARNPEATGGNGAIELGIGLHAGDAFCGAVGDETRLEFTVLGDTVNIAARLEQETKAVGLPLVVSRAFLAAAGERIDARNWQQLGARTLRGRAKPVDLLGACPFSNPQRVTNSR
jgi:adenylate cyclase